MSLDVHPILDVLTQARRETGSMNTATMTFVVFFEDQGLAGWVRERAKVVGDKHPSRVIILDGTQPVGEQHAEPSTKRGEWLEIGVARSEAPALSAAVSMLALNEAPIVLTWIARALPSDVRFPTLAARAQTVIVSSSVLDNGIEPLCDLIDFVEAHPEIDVKDIAYLRLATWQELIADFFDEPPFRKELDNLRRVEITAGSDAEAYYLLGWLASRLEWSPCGKNEFCNRNKEIIDFEIRRGSQPRRVDKVVLRSPGTTFAAEVFQEDPNAVCIEVAGARSRPRRCAPLFGLDIASLVERAILARSRDQVYAETLTLAKQLIERQR